MKKKEIITSIEDLKKGDILLFTPEKGCIVSEAISYFTNSEISHSGIYIGNGEFIHEYPPFILKQNLNKYLKKCSVYVKRFSNKNISLDPVIMVANKYLENKEVFSFNGIILIVSILMFDKSNLPNNVKIKLINLLKTINKFTDDFKSKGLINSNQPMHCSQLVYQCFKEAGTEYDLALFNTVINSNNGGLINLVKMSKCYDLTDYKVNIRESSLYKTVEYPIKELLEAFRDEPVQTSTRQVVDYSKDIISLCKNIFDYLNIKNFKTVSGCIKKFQPIFVTPFDLNTNCKNLTAVGYIPSTTKAPDTVKQ